jgi:hypothetical protein
MICGKPGGDGKNEALLKQGEIGREWGPLYLYTVVDAANILTSVPSVRAEHLYSSTSCFVLAKVSTCSWLAVGEEGQPHESILTSRRV